MKKSILLAAVILIAAQLSSFGQMKVTGGYLNNEIKASESGFNFSLSGDGFYVGILGQSPFGDNPNMFFEPGLMFDYITYKAVGVKTSMYFLRAPLHLRYDFDFGSKNSRDISCILRTTMTSFSFAIKPLENGGWRLRSISSRARKSITTWRCEMNCLTDGGSFIKN